MSDRDDVLAQTSAGTVQGAALGDIYIFKGIPYAAPPVGERRYRRSVPPDSWEGVRPAVEPGPAPIQAPQAEGGMASRYRVLERTDEDCLYLNVWTPGLDRARRPVVVFVHGGAYLGGSGAVEVYDGTHYAEGGAVFVTCNYRLGGLGFMHIDEYFPGLESTGNLGILDVVRMLEWIQDNIARFGGDPDNVTLTGSSSGAITTAALLASPLGKGLFRRAVLMSSASGHTTLTDEIASKIGRRFIDHLGVAPGDLDGLLALPGRSVRYPVRAPVDRHRRHRRLVAVVPGRRRQRPGGPRHRRSRRGCRRRRRRAAGSRRRRTAVGIPRRARGPASHLTRDRELLQQHDLEGAVRAVAAAVDEVRRIYERSIVGRGREFDDVEFASAAGTDYVMAIPTVQFAAAHSSNEGRTFLYRFTWPSPLLDGFLGSFHGLGTPFFFDNLDHPAWAEVLGPEPPVELARGFRETVIGFATDGDPNVGSLPSWPPYTIETRETMILDMPPRILRDPEAERRGLWEGWR